MTDAVGSPRPRHGETDKLRPFLLVNSSRNSFDRGVVGVLRRSSCSSVLREIGNNLAGVRDRLICAQRDYGVLGVIERNERDAQRVEIDGRPTQDVVKSGIVKGYCINLVVDAIRDNPRS